MHPKPRSGHRLAEACGLAAYNEDWWLTGDCASIWPYREATRPRRVKYDLDELAARLASSVLRPARTSRRQNGPVAVRQRSALSSAAKLDVTILEVGPRDGLQNIKTHVPTQTKIELIRRLANTGLRNIEATSFVSPKWIPQLADCKDVLKEAKAISEPKNIWMPVLTPNMKGLELAVQNGAKEVVVFASASEGFSKANTNCSIEEALDRSRQIVEAAKEYGIRARGVISCVVACPYDGPTDPTKVLEIARRFLQMGCYEVGLGETIGVGTPYDIEKLLRVLLAEIPAEKLAGHYHDTYGQAIANVVKSYEMGIRAFDSSVAGLGGCPYAKGAKGNLATEDLVYTFEKAGIRTGIDLQQLVEIGHWISRELNIPNNSRAGSAIVARSQSADDVSAKQTTTMIGQALRWTVVDDKGDYQIRRAANVVARSWDE